MKQPPKHSLAAAYSVKRQALRKKSMPQSDSACPECGMADCAHMARGGAVPELEDAHAEAAMAPHELVDEDMSGPEESNEHEADRPEASESLSLAAQIMKDRARLKMAKGGEVPSELDAPEEDGREDRGLDLEPVHVMEDDEHDQSDASLVAQILMDRKKRRAGM